MMQMNLGGGDSIRHRGWMMFVDGENLAIQAEKIARAEGRSLRTGNHYEPGIFLWFPDEKGWKRTTVGGGRLPLDGLSLRSFYYTSVQGSEEKLRAVKESLSNLGFHPVVFKKMKEQRRKRVDIQLTIDMLTNAFMNNYEACVLVAGDQDYVPIVEEVQRRGKVVSLAFFEHAQGGLHPDLKLGSDFFTDITPALLERCCE